MSDIRKLLESFDTITQEDDDVLLEGDSFDIELNEHFLIETGIIGFTEDGVVLHGDDALLEFLELNGIVVEDTDLMVDEGTGAIRTGLAAIALIASLWGVNYKMAQDAYKMSPQLQQLTQYYEYAKEQGDERMMKQLKNRIGSHKLRIDLGHGEVRGDDFQPIEVVYDKEGIIKDIDENDELSKMKRLLSTVGKMSNNGVEVNGKPVNVKSIEVDGVDTKDYPDFADAYASYAEFEDGTPLSDQELEILQDKHGDVVYQAVQDSLFEAKYQGRTVPLNKPMKGDVAKSKVYVKNAKGNVVKVNFGDKNMKIKKSNPKRRKSFRARHNCANPGPKWKARYWSCRAW